MNEAPLPEPLEQFLQAPPQVPISVDLRAELLAATTALLPRRRRWARWAIASAVAASIAAAFVAGYVIGRQKEIDRAPAPRQELVEQAPTKPPSTPKVATQPMAATALEIENQAFDTADDKARAQLYFQAGDVYLARNQDCDAALRCYRQALSDCAADDLEVKPDDNWLVAALKRDHRKER